jgi:hypothetical protein
LKNFDDAQGNLKDAKEFSMTQRDLTKIEQDSCEIQRIQRKSSKFHKIMTDPEGIMKRERGVLARLHQNSFSPTIFNHHKSIPIVKLHLHDTTL